MHKLIILPGVCDALGGTLVTLSLLIQGFKKSGFQNALYVLVRTGSVMEKYLYEAGHKDVIKTIPAKNQAEFCKKALQWIGQQPKEYPLLLDNCVQRDVQLAMLPRSLRLRLSGRKIYHFFHDLALSYNRVGYLLRKLTFTLLSPKGISNSRFTVEHIRKFCNIIIDVMYQPVDTELFNKQVSASPPAKLQSIINTGAKIILTPSRISQPKSVNDKNLRALIPVLTHLKTGGYNFHSVIVGQDLSPDKIYTQELIDLAKKAGVDDCFTILPPTFRIQDYYHHSDIVLTLAPREPFGRVVVEAIACGVPVVGSFSGGIGEILRQAAPEWMVNPDSSVDVAEKIVYVAENSTTNTLIQARNWVEEHCSVNGYAKKMMEITDCTDIDEERKDIELSSLDDFETIS